MFENEHHGFTQSPNGSPGHRSCGGAFCELAWRKERGQEEDFVAHGLKAFEKFRFCPCTPNGKVGRTWGTRPRPKTVVDVHEVTTNEQ